MEDNYPKAYKEVLEILNYVPKESVDKIPPIMLETFKINMDKDYYFIIDINKNFEEQDILDETKAILANIFRDYWATPYQRERIEAKEKYDRQKIEEVKREMYNPDDIFKTKQQRENENIDQNENYSKNLPVEVKKEKFYQKILSFFKRLFHL